MQTDKELLEKAFALLTKTLNIIINDKLDLVKEYAALEAEITTREKMDAKATPKPSLFTPAPTPVQVPPVQANTPKPTAQPKAAPMVEESDDPFENLPDIPYHKPKATPIDDLPFDHPEQRTTPNPPFDSLNELPF